MYWWNTAVIAILVLIVLYMLLQMFQFEREELPKPTRIIRYCTNLNDIGYHNPGDIIELFENDNRKRFFICKKNNTLFELNKSKIAELYVLYGLKLI